MNGCRIVRCCFESPATYQIAVLGEVPPAWSERLEGMSCSVVSTSKSVPVTYLVGNLLDQNALAGVINTLIELHLPLLSVQRLSPRTTAARG